MSYDIIVGRNESDKKNFGDRGLILIGKSYVKMGPYTSLSNKIYMDIVRSHVVLVAGKRGSGKSYTLGVIAEELSNLPKESRDNVASIIFDTMGIYWTMKHKNEKERDLLRDWELQSKNLPVKIFVPFGYYDEYLEKGISGDEKFALDPNEMTSEDWILTFGLDIINPIAVLIERALSRLKNKKYYNIEDIIKELESDKKSTVEIINAAAGLFEAAQTWGIFARNSKEATKVSDLINAGTTSVLDLSVYNSIGAFNVRALVISLLSRKIFIERMSARKQEEVESVAKGLDFLSANEKKENPLVWIFIDEAHEFLPLNGKTIATDALIQILREGRQPGLSLVLATQQPGQINRDVMTQSDIVISHRVTSAPDLEALNQIMQSYLLESIKQQMDDLPSLKGSAIILDDNSERIYPMQVRPRFTWHGGEAPTAIQAKKKI
jgi:DNA helicase HerA-like ATPase